MNLSGKKIVVTGGAGLIGSFLVERLVGSGAKVVVADDFSKGRKKYLASVLEKIEIREGDLEQRELMDRALVGAEIVFHLASRAYGIGYSAKNHLNILQHNECITNNLIDVLAHQTVEHLLVVSSSCVYSDIGPDTVGELALFTGEPETTNWGYGWSKRFLEQKSMILSDLKKIPLTIVRPFNIYGERYTWLGQGSQAIPMQVKKVLDGEDPVEIWGSGMQRRNYLHASDCADAMAGLVEQDFVGTVNIGTEQTISLQELVETICRLSGYKPKLITDKTKPEGRRIKSSDSTLLRRAYPGFHMNVGLEEGLARMIGWYDEAFHQEALNP